MRRIVGCMTGTSIDGLDAAIVEIDGEGPDVRARFVRGVSVSLGEAAPGLRAFAEGAAMTARELARLALEFGELHATTIERLAARDPIDLVALHGQTVFHAPPVSWQLVNPWPVAQRLDCAVVSDLRAADLAAGGQGAPITPLADWILFRAAGERRAIVNLGGFCNTTLLPDAHDPRGTSAIRGFDVCACNHVLDAVARRALGAPFDESGAAAMRGAPHDQAIWSLVDALARQAAAGRSLGTGDEVAGWIDAWADRLAPDDLARTAADGAGAIIARACAESDAVILAGGGARNAALVRALTHAAGRPVRTTGDLGVPGEFREAACMAVLAALAADGVDITLPQVTNRGAAPRAGLWINAKAV